jgi:hypothetical protein
MPMSQKRVMKNIAAFFFVLIASQTFAQSENRPDVVEEISSFVREAKVKELSSYFDVTVELTIEERENTYSKAQAEIIIKNFFSKNPPKSFRLMHRGASEKGGRYLIGLLTNEQGTQFRTSIVLIEKNDTFVIQQLRFE